MVNTGLIITALDCDKWVGAHNMGSIIENPTWLEIEAAIRALDQARHTLVRLFIADGAYMAIGGGRGDYIATVTAETGHSVTLNAEGYTYHFPPRRTAPTIKIVIGGQAGDYATRYVLILEDATDSAMGWAYTGGLNSCRSWTRQDDPVW